MANGIYTRQHESSPIRDVNRAKTIKLLLKTEMEKRTKKGISKRCEKCDSTITCTVRFHED